MWANFVEPVVVEKEEETADSNKEPSGPVTKEVVVTHVEDCSKWDVRFRRFHFLKECDV